MTDKLKPCPFCGGGKIEVSKIEEWNVWYAQCKECLSVNEPNADYDETIKQWNTRPLDTNFEELQSRIAELDNELSALRTKWDELPAFLVKQDEADIFDEHNLNMLLIEYLLDIKPEKK